MDYKPKPLFYEILTDHYRGIEYKRYAELRDGSFVLKEELWHSLQVFGSPEIEDIIVPSYIDVLTARFLEQYFCKPIIMSTSDWVRTTHGTFWDRILDLSADEVRYVFRRLDDVSSEFVLSKHVDLNHPNSVLGIMILLERGVNFPDDYFSDCDFSRYSELDEFVAEQRPNIDRLRLLKLVISVEPTAGIIISRPFFQDILPQFTTLERITSPEVLKIFLDRDLIPKDVKTLATFIETGPRGQAFLRMIIENYPSALFDEVVKDMEDKPNHYLPFLIELFISGHHVIENFDCRLVRMARLMAESLLINPNARVKSSVSL